ncbi:MAG TPA: flagellar assembly protein FliW, partial [Tepidisphaeraceae bacterium]|nr:flagellar assembly protein FliW [Tepidisphaeraceae bacterium]
ADRQDAGGNDLLFAAERRTAGSQRVYFSRRSPRVDLRPVAQRAPGRRKKWSSRMDIESTRFGRLTVDDDRIITVPKGLLGFPNFTRYALIQTGEENYFFWLQSIDEPNLAFVVTDPSIFFKDYEVPIREETQSELQLTDVGFAQVFVICNKVDEWLTGNLLGPIVVNAQNRMGQQVVLTEKKWTTRQPLLKLQAEVPLAKSA